MNPSRQIGQLARLHVASALAVAATYSIILRDQPPIWLMFWVAGLALSSAAAFRPELGLAAYAMTLYGTPRYSSLFSVLARSHVLSWEALFAVSGAALWMARTRQRPQFASTTLLVGVALFGWIGVTAAIPRSQSAHPIDSLYRSPVFLLHAFWLMVVASQVMRTAATTRTFTWCLCLGLSVRVFWQGITGLRLENDVGPLVLIVLPLMVLLARTDADWRVKVLMSGAAAGAFVTVALTYNRASAVAFVAAALVTCWHNRRNVRLLGATMACLVAAAVWLTATPYWNRFQGAWAELRGSAEGSVTERLRLWRAGFSIVIDHPVVGVGPGRYASEVADYAPALQGMVAHNSFVHVAAETGLPGLALYAALFLTTLFVAQRTVRRASDAWSRATLEAIQTSLVAYLVAGLFISRHDMVLAYILVGWVAALATISREATWSDPAARQPGGSSGPRPALAPPQ